MVAWPKSAAAWQASDGPNLVGSGWRQAAVVDVAAVEQRLALELVEEPSPAHDESPSFPVELKLKCSKMLQ